MMDTSIQEKLDELEIRLFRLEPIQEDFTALGIRVCRLEKQVGTYKETPFDKFWSDNSYPDKIADYYKETWNAALEEAISELLLNSKDTERLRAIKV